MFYSLLRRAVTHLFGVFDKHSSFVFSSSNFKRQNEKNKKKTKTTWRLIRRPSCLGTGDKSDLCQFYTVALKISGVRNRDELKCRCAVRLMSQCCRALLKLLASQWLHRCLQAQESLLSGGHPSCRFLLAGLRSLPKILGAAENKSDVPEFPLEIAPIHFNFKTANVGMKSD